MITETNIFKSKYAKRKQESRLRMFIDSAFPIVIIMVFVGLMLSALVECIDEEARVDERKRIAARVSHDLAEQTAYSNYLSKFERAKR